MNAPLFSMRAAKGKDCVSHCTRSLMPNSAQFRFSEAWKPEPLPSVARGNMPSRREKSSSLPRTFFPARAAGTYSA